MAIEELKQLETYACPEFLMDSVQGDLKTIRLNYYLIHDVMVIGEIGFLLSIPVYIRKRHSIDDLKIQLSGYVNCHVGSLKAEKADINLIEEIRRNKDFYTTLIEGLTVDSYLVTRYLTVLGSCKNRILEIGGKSDSRETYKQRDYAIRWGFRSGCYITIKIPKDGNETALPGLIMFYPTKIELTDYTDTRNPIVNTLTDVEEIAEFMQILSEVQ